jgi:hypothetical protein
MDSRYKRKALTGVGVGLSMAAVGFGLVISERDTAPALAIVGGVMMLAALLLYLWGCAALAKAKGQSTAIVLTFVLGGLFPLVLLLVLPDKNQRRRW